MLESRFGETRHANCYRRTSRRRLFRAANCAAGLHEGLHFVGHPRAPTAHGASLDIDVILAAQTWMFRNEGEFAVIATLNKKHLAQFVPAEHWKDIHPI